MASPKAHCQKSISVTIFTSTAWRTLGLFCAFPIRARGGEEDVPLDRTRVMRIIQIGENKKTHSRGECIGKCILLPIIFGLWQTSSIFGFFFVSLIFSIFFNFSRTRFSRVTDPLVARGSVVTDFRGIRENHAGLTRYCAPFVCVLNGLWGLAVCRLTNKQTNQQRLTHSP